MRQCGSFSIIIIDIDIDIERKLTINNLPNLIFYFITPFSMNFWTRIFVMYFLLFIFNIMNAKEKTISDRKMKRVTAIYQKKKWILCVGKVKRLIIYPIVLKRKTKLTPFQVDEAKRPRRPT